MQDENAKYKLWDYWSHDGITYVVTEETKDKQIPTLRLMWKKNNDSDKKI